MDKIVLFYSNFSVHCKNILTKIDDIDEFDVHKICIDSTQIRKLLSKTNIKVVPHLCIINNNDIKENIVGSDVNTWVESLMRDVEFKKNQQIIELHQQREKERLDMERLDMERREMERREMEHREIGRRETGQSTGARSGGIQPIEENEDFTSLESLGIISRAPKRKDIHDEFEPKGNNFQEDDEFMNEKMKRMKNTVVKPPGEKPPVIEKESEKAISGDLDSIVKQMERNRERSLDNLSQQKK